MRKKPNAFSQSTDPHERFTPAQRQLIERLGKMSPAEGFQTLVSSGIYTPDGKLTPEYGGKSGKRP